MKWTLESVEQEVVDKDYTPVEQEGIPEGFLFQKPNGDYVLFMPSTENTLNARSIEPLLAEYNKKYGK